MTLPRATPTNTRINPRHPRGAKRHDPSHVLYVVERPPAARRQRMWVVASPTWLDGWEIGDRVSVVHDSRQRVIVRGIVDAATMTVEGDVPNVRLSHWLCQETDRKST